MYYINTLQKLPHVVQKVMVMMIKMMMILVVVVLKVKDEIGKIWWTHLKYSLNVANINKNKTKTILI